MFPGKRLQEIAGEIFVLYGRGLEEWKVEKLNGIWKLTNGEIIEDVLCLTIGGNRKLEINCKGNLNKLNESGGNRETGDDDDDFVTDDCDFVTEDGDFEIEVIDLEAEDGDFFTESGDFGIEDCDLVLGDCGFWIDSCLITHGDLVCSSSWGNGLNNETRRYCLGWEIVCITCK